MMTPSVPYSSARDKIRTGDLIAWKVEKIDSIFKFVLYLDHKIFKSEYSHVGIALKLEDRLFVVEATPPGLRIYPLSMCDAFYHLPIFDHDEESNRDVIESIKCEFFNTKLRSRITNELMKHIGKPYSLLDLVKSIFNIRRSEEDFYCSEFAAYIYNAVNYFQDEDAGFKPDTIVKAVLQNNKDSITYVTMDRGNLNGV